jgi:Predicted transcriptional regulator
MRKTKSAILEAVSETARGLHAAGVMDRVMLREFDRLCLPPVGPLAPRKTGRSIGSWLALFSNSMRTTPNRGEST